MLLKSIHKTEITPFKNKEVDRSSRIRVYRNLNRKGVVYSIKQNGLVVGYSSNINMCDCEFIVVEGGKKRALNTKQRNVHAYIEGHLCMFYEGEILMGEIGNLEKPAKITYKPFTNNKFVCLNYSDKPIEVIKAKGVVLNEDGVTGYSCTLKK